MKPYRISRRFLLRGAGSLGVALPLLDIMQPLRRASAQTTAPKRFVVMYEQSGIIYSQWKPSGSADSFTLSPTLAPLEPYKAKLIVLDGLSNTAATKGMGDDHQKGIGSMLTGIETVGSTASPSGGGISIDQQIASQVGTSTKFKSLELGVLTFSGSILNYMAYSGASKPLTAQSDPAQVYSRVFANFTAPTSGGGTTTGVDPAAARLVTERRSILDAMKEGYTSLISKASVADRAKLDAHLTSIREIEKSLAADPAATTMTSVGAACVKPASQTIDARKNDNFPAIAKLQIDLLSMALICDLTRVVTLQFSYEAGDPVFSWLGSSRGHHAISHDADSVSSSQTELAKIDKWHCEQFAYLLSKLQGAAEGTGTVLDNTLAMWTNGLAKGNIHSHGPNPPQPIVMAGSVGGYFKTGRFLTVARGTNTNDVYISALQAFGGTATTFGNPSYCKGPLAALRG